VWKPEGKRPLGRLRRRWEDNIKMDRQELGCGDGPDRADSVEGQVAGTFECGNEFSGSMQWRELLDCLRTGEVRLGYQEGLTLLSK
jgi:FKBP-type peptidyl-prolyl cis-trans isomerase